MANQEIVVTRKLPTIVVKGKEWTVDERLREFRFARVDVGLEFVPFDSEKGLELLEVFWKNQDNREEEAL